MLEAVGNSLTQATFRLISCHFDEGEILALGEIAEKRRIKLNLGLIQNHGEDVVVHHSDWLTIDHSSISGDEMSRYIKQW